MLNTTREDRMPLSAALADSLPPQSLEAEQATLGAALISRTAVERVLEILEREDFYLEAHRKIYDVIAYLVERDSPPDVLTVPEELRRRNQLEAVGGVSYVSSLAESVPTAAHVEYYARTVARKSTLRKLIDAAAEIRAMAHNQEEEVDDVVDQSERLIFSVAQRRGNQGFVSIRPVLLDAMERLEEVRAADSRLTGITSGFDRIDQMTSGLQGGDMIIVAGRPSMGKTSLALAFAVNAAVTDHPVAVFSLEMSKEQLAHRLICSEAKVDGMRLRTGFLRTNTHEVESDWTRLGRAIGRLGDLPIFIDDSSDISVLEMRAKCRRLKSEHGLGLVVVDYLQLIRGHGRQENRNQEISTIARSLKSMARELDCPVVALSQLSRGVERREDKRPMLSDLRESGSIEAEADIVMMLYRSRYYSRDGVEEDENAVPPPGQDWVEESELIIAKHRNGPVGTVRLGFLRKYARFENLAEEYDGHEP
jgi:replicative DNA helicase